MSLQNLMKRYKEKTGRPAMVNSQYLAAFVEGLAELFDMYEKERIDYAVKYAVDRSEIEREILEPISKALGNISDKE